MGVLGREPFSRSLGRLDSRSFVSFVAAVYDARGSVAGVEGSTIRLADGRTVACIHRGPISARLAGPPQLPAEADVVVSATPSARGRTRAVERGARYVGPRGLRSLLLYGIDRGVAENLCQEHLGRPLPVEDPHDRARGTNRARATDRSRDRSGHGSRLLAAGLSVLVVVAAVVALLGGPALVVDTDRGASAGSAGVGGVSGVVGPTGAGVAVARTPETERVPYPPGVDADGVRDASVLANAHRQAVGNRSYQLLLRGHGDVRSVRPWPPGVYLYAGAPRWASLRQRISVEHPTVYRSRLTGLRADESGGDMIVVDDYADGRAIYRRYGGNATPKFVRVTNREDLVGYAAGEFLIRFLSTSETRVERIDEDWFRIVATGNPLSISDPIRNYSAVAVVSRSGFVSRLSVSYERPVSAAGSESGVPGNIWKGRSMADAPTRETAFSFEYSDVNRTEVPRPPWYEAARQTVGAGDHPTGIEVHREPDGNWSGSVTPVALAETHGAAVRGRSYEWRVRQRGATGLGLVDGRWEYLRKTAVLETDRRYSYRVIGVRDGNGTPVPVDYGLYADGDRRYWRLSGAIGATPVYRESHLSPDPPDPFAGVAEQYVRRYLAASDVRVRVVDDPATQIRYRVVATGRPTRIDGAVSDYRAVANVTADGFVRSLAVSYLRHDSTGHRHVTVGYEYDRVGNATVDQPDWYATARTATGT